jgi:hypothetical protein
VGIPVERAREAREGHGVQLQDGGGDYGACWVRHGDCSGGGCDLEEVVSTWAGVGALRCTTCEDTRQTCASVNVGLELSRRDAWARA